MITKYSSRGMAIRTTSSGICTISLPLRLNITTMVKSRAINVMGLMNGMKRVSYHFLPFRRISTKREINPARNGMPR